MHNDDIDNMIRMDVKLDSYRYTEIDRMLAFKNTCRTNGFIIRSLITMLKKINKLY